MKDFLSIKEFAVLTGIKQTTLRYWDGINLFSPTVRASENKYRYYSIEQLIDVNFIKVMHALGLSLKAISVAQQNRNPEGIVKLLQSHEKNLDIKMNHLRDCYSIIHTRHELITKGLQHVNEQGFHIIHEDSRTIILGSFTDFKDEDELFYNSFLNFLGQANALRINLNYPIGGFHNNLKSFTNAPNRPDRFFSTDPSGNSIIPSGLYLVGFSRGCYGHLDDTFTAGLLTYAKERSIRTSGPVYSLYIHDEICAKNPDDYLIQTCIAIVE